MKITTWYVYILQCKDGTLYTGITTDVARRVEEHNGGGPRAARYTRSRRPVRLLYLEAATSRSDAAKREYAIKRLAKQDKEAVINGGPGPRDCELEP